MDSRFVARCDRGIGDGTESLSAFASDDVPTTFVSLPCPAVHTYPPPLPPSPTPSLSVASSSAATRCDEEIRFVMYSYSSRHEGRLVMDSYSLDKKGRLVVYSYSSRQERSTSTMQPQAAKRR